ncbi:ribosome maturation factor RimM [Myceligenerans indicum]|uniref:Ribosome maturation factor RimM n=1 Tax=Myceligenerans indicum TaxID=2593663 RepID=A0ABS1LKV3_9MICO|nr:ribosome maturation factor RimM [Myceligenerans indicum]MBL0886458.1 ribosome maturation factor RimM [Myceligenerans indicum]
MELTVARIGRAHGLKGDVALDLRTDDPGERLGVGQVLRTVPADAGPLTVTRARVQQDRWVVAFAEVADRTAAERLRGVELVVEADNSEEEDAWYPHELRGLRAELANGTVVGEVIGLDHLPAHDVLVVSEPLQAGKVRTLVPFVKAIVPVVDIDAGRVVLDPPGGLLARDAVDAEVDVEVDAEVDEPGAGRDGADGKA